MVGFLNPHRYTAQGARQAHSAVLTWTLCSIAAMGLFVYLIVSNEPMPGGRPRPNTLARVAIIPCLGIWVWTVFLWSRWLFYVKEKANFGGTGVVLAVTNAKPETFEQNGPLEYTRSGRVIALWECRLENYQANFKCTFAEQFENQGFIVEISRLQDNGVFQPVQELHYSFTWSEQMAFNETRTYRAIARKSYPMGGWVRDVVEIYDVLSMSPHAGRRGQELLAERKENLEIIRTETDLDKADKELEKTKLLNTREVQKIRFETAKLVNGEEPDTYIDEFVAPRLEKMRRRKKAREEIEKRTDLSPEEKQQVIDDVETDIEADEMKE